MLIYGHGGGIIKGVKENSISKC